MGDAREKCKSTIPNFLKETQNFLDDVFRVPKSISGWGMTSNHFSRDQMNYWKGYRDLVAR